MKRHPAYVGIDPGGSGAAAIIYASGYYSVVDLRRGADSEAHTISTEAFAGARFFVENVHSMPKQGVASTFKFGVSVGRVLGALEATGADYVFVQPQAWKKHFGLLKKDKSVALEIARKMFPEAPLTRAKDHNRAEALLIAEYGRFLVTGEKRAY